MNLKYKHLKIKKLNYYYNYKLVIKSKLYILWFLLYDDRNAEN